MKIPLYRLIDKYIGPIIILALVLFKPFKKRPRDIKNVAIIRLWAIGESVLTLPLIKRIRESYPKAIVTVICTNRNKTVFENLDFIDKIETLNPKIIIEFNRYDISIDTEPYLKLASIINFWIAKYPIGYNHKLSRILNKSNIDFNDNIHAADNFVRLGKAIGVNQKKLDSLIELNPGKQDLDWAKKFTSNLNKPIIGICPTAGESAKSREWSDKKWVNLLNQIYKKYKSTIIFVSSKDNKVKIKLLQDLLNFKTLDTTDLNLQQSIALISQLDLMISIDTGPMHIAAAQQVSTIGLFCPNTPIRFGPLGKKNSYVYKPVLPKPCINVHKGEIPNCRNHQHMKNIDVVDVVKEIDKLNRKWKILQN